MLHLKRKPNLLIESPTKEVEKKIKRAKSHGDQMMISKASLNGSETSSSTYGSPQTPIQNDTNINMSFSDSDFISSSQDDAETSVGVNSPKDHPMMKYDENSIDKSLSNVAKSNTITSNSKNVGVVQMNSIVSYNSVAWGKSRSYPWWPMYICEAKAIESVFKGLGENYMDLYSEALEDPEDIRICYFFGSQRFGLCSIRAGSIENWGTEYHSTFMTGVPKKLLKGSISEVFHKAIEEAEEYLSTDMQFKPYVEMLANSNPSSDDSTSTSMDGVVDIPYDTVCWAHLKGFPWLPVYIIDPFKLKEDLSILGNGHAKILQEARENPQEYRIVYYFDSHNFGLHKNPNNTIKMWNCSEHDEFCFPKPKKKKQPGYRLKMKKALEEVEEFMSSDKKTRLLPYMTNSDMKRDRKSIESNDIKENVHSNPHPIHQTVKSFPSNESNESNSQDSPRIESSRQRTMRSCRLKSSNTSKSVENFPVAESTPKSNPHRSREKKALTIDISEFIYGTVAWALLKGFPWMPVCILDPFHLKRRLHLLGSGHRAILMEARENASICRIVYYFGSHNFGLHTIHDDTLRLWNCNEHSQFIEGRPKYSTSKLRNKDNLEIGIQEAECYLKSNPLTRLPPYMVPSDFDLSLKPPIPELLSYETLGWAISDGYPWMPVYVLDPFKFEKLVVHVGKAVEKKINRAIASPDTLRLVYYFGGHKFGIHRLDGSLKPWNCPEHSQFLLAKSDSLIYFKPSIHDDFDEAMKEVEIFILDDRHTRILKIIEVSGIEIPNKSKQNQHPIHAKSITSKDMNIPEIKHLEMSEARNIPSQTNMNSNPFAWAFGKGGIWWPVYICCAMPSQRETPDDDELSSRSHDAVQVYHFGFHEFENYSSGSLRPWNGAQHDAMMNGNASIKDMFILSRQFSEALLEAADFIKTYQQLLRADKVLEADKNNTSNEMDGSIESVSSDESNDEDSVTEDEISESDSEEESGED